MPFEVCNCCSIWFYVGARTGPCCRCHLALSGYEFVRLTEPGGCSVSRMEISSSTWPAPLQFWFVTLLVYEAKAHGAAASSRCAISSLSGACCSSGERTNTEENTMKARTRRLPAISFITAFTLMTFPVPRVGAQIMESPRVGMQLTIQHQQSTTGPEPPIEVIERDAARAAVIIEPMIEETLPVPGYNWRHGCGPTAVGMV